MASLTFFNFANSSRSRSSKVPRMFILLILRNYHVGHLVVFAVFSENPALQSKVFIFVGMVESIAIYGIVMMFIILGQ